MNFNFFDNFFPKHKTHARVQPLLGQYTAIAKYVKRLNYLP